ncbi:MAG: ABC transporter substrate-binding protein [Thermodesulfobacteriota bacterium]
MASSLRVGYLSTLYHTSHLLRQLRWIEQDLEVDCRWQLYGTGPEMVRAFDRHHIDIGYIGLPPALIGMARGVPLVCVGGGHVEGTVMVAGPSFRSLAESDGVRSFLQQFRNRRVGIPAAGSIHDVIFRALLLEHSVAEVEVVNTPWADLIPYMFRKGELHAAVGTPPLALLCERECGTRTVMPPEALWPFNPSYGIVARREMLEQEDLIEGFLRLHEGACNLIRESPQRAARCTVSALPGLDEPFVRGVYAVSPKYCASLPEAYVESTLAFVPVMKQLGYVSESPRLEEIFASSFIEKVHPDAHHYHTVLNLPT